jgi:4'-phosphopantetheinyl transferase
MTEVFAVRLNFDKGIHPSLQDELMSRVDPQKELRLRRFIREEDRLRGLFADLLIRDLVMQKTGLTNEDIEFSTNEYGKPYLSDVENFQFNLSHSGDWVVGAIDEQPVGIDIEKIQPIDLDISENYFSPDEHRDLMAQPDRIAYFFTLWSLKESYIKILGKGLSHPLNAFSIKFMGADEIIIQVDGKPLENVVFTQYHIDEKYKMGLCAYHNNMPKRVNMLTMDQLGRRFVSNYDAVQHWNRVSTNYSGETSGFDTYKKTN